MFVIVSWFQPKHIFAGKARIQTLEWTPVGRLLALLAYIILGGKWLTVTNTLYFQSEKWNSTYFAFSLIIEGRAEKALQFILPLQSIYNQNLGFIQQKTKFLNTTERFKQ